MNTRMQIGKTPLKVSRQAIDGLTEVFSNGTDHERQDHETEVRDLHAKIGQLMVERDFLAGGLKR
jgi:transposase